MSDGGAPLRIVIVGDGVTAASVAAALSTALPKSRYAIALLPIGKASNEDETVVATSPSVRNFHARLNLDEDTIVRTCSGSFTLGVAYAGWSAARPAYFLPYGDIGATLNGVPFHHQVARLRANGESIQPGDFSLAVILAQAGRFTLPARDQRSVLSTFGYGLHLPGPAYAAFLQDQARAMGATVHAPAGPVQLRRNEHNFIVAVLASDGREVAGDLFIDASGPPAVLMSASGESGFEDWSSAFGCDRILSLRCRTTSPPSPYSLVAAHTRGWMTTVPANGELGETFAYASEFMSDDEARESLLEALHGTPASEVTVSPLSNRRALQPWSGNCIAVGSAAGTPEPGRSSLDLVHASIERLLQLIPVTMPAQVEAREYNRLTVQELDRARDMAGVRFQLNGRKGEPFWDRLRGQPRSGELGRKLAEFERRGRVPLVDGDRADEGEWALLLDELGIRPKRHDILADAIPLDALNERLLTMRKALIDAAAGVPPHGDYLDGLLRKHAA